MGHIPWYVKRGYTEHNQSFWQKTTSGYDKVINVVKKVAPMATAAGTFFNYGRTIGQGLMGLGSLASGVAGAAYTMPKFATGFQGAMQGAAAGSVGGPIGAAIGGLTGGAIGFLANPL